MFFKKSILALALLAFGLAVTGCDDPAPNVVVSDGTTYDFDRVALGQSKLKIFTLTNDGERDGTLGDLSAAGLNLEFPFAVTGGTCIAGSVLAPSTSCTINVTFTPSTAGVFTDSLEVAVTGTEYKGVAKRGLRGTGYLDCNSSPALAMKYGDGSTDAQARNQQEAAAGTIAGAALTFSQGYTKGYQASYDAGYDQGWDDRYTPGYNSGYNQGYNQGINDFSTCFSGNLAGQSAGRSDGLSDGRVDGYNVGYTDGYASGYTEGHDVGYDNGSEFCPLAAPRKPIPARNLPRDLGTAHAGGDSLDTSENLQACYDQGYGDTYNPNSYWNAYNLAAEGNPDYQNGLRTGRTQGLSDGRADGEADGFAAGRTDGNEDGLYDGTVIAYDTCYANAYSVAYEDGYDDGFGDLFSGYPAGFSSGDYDGYFDGYDVGYSEAQFDYCGTFTAKKSSSAVAKSRAYGLNQSWARKASNGVTVQAYARKPMPLLKLLSEQSKKQIEAARTKARNDADSKLRPTLRVELLKAPKSRD